MGYKFEPKLTYREMGDGQVEICFQWRPKCKTKLLVDLDVFEEYQKFAETLGIERFRHLADALNWDTANEHLTTLVFAIDLLYYFPFQKTVKFTKEASPK